MLSSPCQLAPLQSDGTRSKGPEWKGAVQVLDQVLCIGHGEAVSTSRQIDLSQTQILFPPSFLGTTTTGEAHADWPGSTIPCCSSSVIVLSKKSFSGCGHRYAFCLIGWASPVSILCTRTVHLPNSSVDVAKTTACRRNRSQRSATVDAPADVAARGLP
jgi:hypothetical protein